MEDKKQVLSLVLVTGVTNQGKCIVISSSIEERGIFRTKPGA